jgi:feruloyl-CoA synthase
MLLSDPPQLDAGEITDKGYLNQRACLDRRVADVAALYTPAGHPQVVLPAAAGQAGLTTAGQPGPE